MILLHDLDGTRLQQRQGFEPVNDHTIWIDLVDPTVEEDAYLEKQLGIAIPTRAETREIESSSRLYQENGAHYMTAFVVYNIEAALPASSTVTFIMTRNRLITVRYHDLKAFPLFLSRVEKQDLGCGTPPAIMLGLIEALISRAADLVERIQDDVERNAHHIFDIKGGQQTRDRRFDVILKAAGRQGDINSRTQESAFSLERLLTYLTHVLKERHAEPALLARVDTAHRDVHSLMEHMRFLASRIEFLLDATLGTINMQQNGIIKIFSVASVALMPPTLIASIYGMNFKHMPELDVWWAYPAALVGMLLSAILPFVYFRRKGWF
ncbi:MAG: magnesium transporter CorA family protein [Hyphomicrobiaceae bacterium]